MSKAEQDVQNFIKRIQPSIRYFYRAAYAITADHQMAEFVLGAALIDAYLRGSTSSGKLGFRDSILSVIREKALEQLKSESSENDWDGLPAAPDADRLTALIMQEPLDVQRMLTLRYGCAMTVREIGTLMNLTPNRVQEQLNQSRLRIERTLAREKLPFHPFDKLAMRALRRRMNHEAADQIDVSFLLHSFETELNGRRRSRRILLKIVRTVLISLFALICAAILWLLAVLMEM